MNIVGVNDLKLKQLQNNCRCCLAPGCYKDISSEYYFSGQKEVYEDMLKRTLDVKISLQNNTSRLICDSCITKLREAYEFKQVILQTQQTILQYLKVQGALLCSEKEDIITLDAKQNLGLEELEQIKLEIKEDGSEYMQEEIRSNGDVCDFKDDVGFDCDDDEVLANIKLEKTKEKILANRKLRSRCKVRKKVKEEDRFPEKYEINDVTKSSDIRGNGPILRENSLKLIENSTICVFQWNRSRYRCFCCKQPFSDMNLLREHTNTEHTIKDICKIIITQQNRLVKVEVSVLFCKICGIELENLNSLRQHLFLTHNIVFKLTEDLLVPYKINSELQCQVCNEKFSKFRHLNIHINKHFQRQVCHICGAGFTNLVFLNLHKSRNHRILNCKPCGLTFDSKMDKKHHDISVHDIKFEKRLRYPCQYCNERFYKESSRVEHLVEKHGMEKPEHKCSLCLKVYITKSLLNNHIKIIHMKEKNKECDICHHLFYTNSDVIRHKVTHTGEKKFSCNVCNTLFATKNSLRRHMKRTHLGIS